MSPPGMHTQRKFLDLEVGGYLVIVLRLFVPAFVPVNIAEGVVKRHELGLAHLVGGRCLGICCFYLEHLTMRRRAPR